MKIPANFWASYVMALQHVGTSKFKNAAIIPCYCVFIQHMYCMASQVDSRGKTGVLVFIFLMITSLDDFGIPS